MKNNKSYIFAIITIMIWGSMAPVCKLVISAISGMQLLFLGASFAFLFLLVVNIINGKIKNLKRFKVKEIGIMAGLGFEGLFMYSALYYCGISQLSSQQACILNYLWPLMIVVFSCVILKDKLSFPKILAMLCSFSGVVVLSLGGLSGTGNLFIGAVACISAAVVYGLFSVLNKKFDFDQNITMMVIWFTVAICSLICILIKGEWVAVHGIQWAGILWIGVGTNAVAYLLWGLAINQSKNVAGVANLAYLTPFITLIISAIFLDEKITLHSFVSLLLIVGGIILQQVLEKRHRSSM